MSEIKDSGVDLKAICAELDKLSLQMLCLMRDYIDCKTNLEDLIKTGSLHLAKSRYIMGNRSVSALQLPTSEGSAEVEASARVGRVEEEEGVVFQLRRMSLGEGESKEGAKRRGGGKEPATSPTVDPIRWFGVLVPGALKRAQAYFDKAVDSCLQAANLQLEMERAKVRYRALMVAKKRLTSQQGKDEDEALP